MKSIIIVGAVLALASCEPKPTDVNDLDLEKLQGLQSECASRAATAAMQSFSTDTDWTDLLSLDNAAEALATVSDGVQLELQNCLTDIYLLGVEDGRVLERDIY